MKAETIVKNGTDKGMSKTDKKRALAVNFSEPLQTALFKYKPRYTV